MVVLEFLRDLWGYAEPLTWLTAISLAAFVFLKDQVRRDRFFGFIPTVITVVFDKSEKKVLVAHLNGGVDRWILPQGRIEGSILDSAREVLRQELNLERAYKLKNSFYLGRVKLRDEEKNRLSRFMDPSEWTLVSRWRGKSYTAIFIETRIEFANRELDGEFLYDQVGFISLAEAQELLSQRHRSEKVELYKQALKQLERQLNKEN